jgi:hypothetical protein
VLCRGEPFCTALHSACSACPSSTPHLDALNSICTSQEVLDCLDVPPDYSTSRPDRAIYCSRTLNLRSIKCIGFDLDYVRSCGVSGYGCVKRHMGGVRTRASRSKLDSVANFAVVMLPPGPPLKPHTQPLGCSSPTAARR